MFATLLKTFDRAQMSFLVMLAVTPILTVAAVASFH